MCFISQRKQHDINLGNNLHKVYENLKTGIAIYEETFCRPLLHLYHLHL